MTADIRAELRDKLGANLSGERSDVLTSLEDVIAEAITRHSTFIEKDTGPTEYGYAICVGCGERRGDREGITHLSRSVLAALIARFGEPEIEETSVWASDREAWAPERRLVFPWMQVES